MNTPTIEQVQAYARKIMKSAMPDYPHDEKHMHIYRAPDGTPIYYKPRVKTHADLPDSVKRKELRSFHWDGSKFVPKEPPAPPEGKPLYALELIAMHQSAVVTVTEGENKADAINKAAMQGSLEDAIVATTSGGASSAQAANWGHLLGRPVVIFPDNDEAGAKYAEDVAQCLIGIAASVNVLDIATLNLPPKGDAVDWLKSGGTLDILLDALMQTIGAATLPDNDTAEDKCRHKIKVNVHHLR